VHQPWIDDCTAQMVQALTAVDAMLDHGRPYLLFDRLTQADIAAFVAERLARVGLRIDTDTRVPRLHALTTRLAEEPAFRATEPGSPL
jgi:glutathione S-transferase